jgi:hypothetical protein
MRVAAAAEPGVVVELFRAELGPADEVRLVVYEDGACGLVRNGRLVGGRRWRGAEGVCECVDAFRALIAPPGGGR